MIEVFIEESKGCRYIQFVYVQPGRTYTMRRLQLSLKEFNAVRDHFCNRSSNGITFNTEGVSRNKRLIRTTISYVDDEDTFLIRSIAFFTEELDALKRHFEGRQHALDTDGV